MDEENLNQNAAPNCPIVSTCPMFEYYRNDKSRQYHRPHYNYRPRPYNYYDDYPPYYSQYYPPYYNPYNYAPWLLGTLLLGNLY